MDFYDILKEAARNKQKAQKELEGNKRYSLNFKPMKKISRPKVNKAAIDARLKKKEEDQRKKAEQEEKEKQRVLALRAEQEAAKTAKRRRDSSSRGSSSTKSEKVPGKKKVVNQDEEREERQERKKVSASFPKEEKHKDFRLNNNHKKEEGRVKSKSVSSKLLPDAKAKPSSAPSFKELMNIAASNAGTSTSSSNTLNGEKEKCSPNVKLKAKADSHRENLKPKTEKSFKREPLPVRKERSSHKVQNSVREPVQQGKSHTGMKVKKKTFFKNTKDASKSESRGPKSRELSPESRGPKSRELSPESRGPKSRELSQKSSSGKLPNSSANQSNLKRASDNSGENQRGERKGKVNREEIGKSVQQPVKRKGGWLDSPVTEPKRKPEESAVRKNGAIKHVVKPNEKRSSIAGEMERSKEKKRGWLDPVPKNPPMGNVMQSESSRGKKLAVSTNATVSKVNKTTPPAAVKAKKQGRLDSERKPTGSVPPAKGKKGGQLDAAKTNSSSGRREKGGWLDPPSAPRERSGGWLGALQEPTESRSGGWLGAVREPSLAARRGRLLSSEDEEEDSDMDDFIDDTPFEGPGGGNVSGYIKEIFGYDSTKYKYESDYALKSMEASYSQILKEEARSDRIAREEDAEEWRKEKELEKKKLAAKAKKKKVPTATLR